MLNRIKLITNFINWLLSLSCIPTNDGSVKYIVTVSFDYIVRLILVKKYTSDLSSVCDVKGHNRIEAVYHFAVIGHHKLSIQIVAAG